MAKDDIIVFIRLSSQNHNWTPSINFPTHSFFQKVLGNWQPNSLIGHVEAIKNSQNIFVWFQSQFSNIHDHVASMRRSDQILTLHWIAVMIRIVRWRKLLPHTLLCFQFQLATLADWNELLFQFQLILSGFLITERLITYSGVQPTRKDSLNFKYSFLDKFGLGHFSPLVSKFQLTLY